MTGSCRLGIAVLGTLLPAPLPAQVFAPETTEVFRGELPVLSHALAHRFLLADTERVLRNGAELAPGSGYRLDADGGVLQLASPLELGEVLAVTYSWVPLDLPRDFVAVLREEPTPADSAGIARPGGSVSERIARAVDEDLVIGGAKTLAIEAGSNKDATVEQSLRVSVTGRIGEDATLTALLSDQNIPLQPEGDTQRLEELDEILIRLDAPRGSATLGDFVARRRGTAFGNFERRLTGAEGRARAGPGDGRAIGATSRGDFRTVEIRGQEGKQGPYVLAGAGLNPTGVIVAGSERVWLDGTELTRGNAHDYVIDYSRGELEFTNRRLVTSDSEIAVDFEVAEQEYRRNFYLGEAGLGGSESFVEWRASIASEADDHDPLNITLSEERRVALEAAGDVPVLVSGADCGEDGGDYVPVADHFEYFKSAGADSGTCRVSFTFLGPGLGDYVRDRDLDTGLSFFRFVGAGAGDHAPGLLLSAPRTSSLADLGLRIGGQGPLTLSVDGAASRQDRNTLSSLDDGDNEGTAGNVALSWEHQRPRAEGAPIRLLAESSFRHEAGGFRSLGRTRDAYLGEVWNFVDTTRTDESVGEVRALLEDADRWSLSGALGVMDREGRFRSTRREGRARVRGGRITSASAQVESARREDEASPPGTVTGDLLRARADMATRFGVFEPGAAFWKEEREEVRADSSLSGRNEVEGSASLAVRPSSSAQAGFRFARRVTQVVREGAWSRESVGRTWAVDAETRPGRRGRARLSWIRRELDFVGPTPDRTTHLTRADLAHESFSGFLNGEYVYETTSRFFTDVIAREESPEEPTLAVNASARIRIGASSRRGRSSEELSPWRRLIGLFRAESLARVEEETTREDRTPIYLLDFSRFQDDEHTVFGKILLREEITLFPGPGPFSLTARWERIDTEDNRADPERVDLLTQRSVLRAVNRLGARWTLESQGSREQDERSDSGTGVTRFDVRRTALREEIVVQPGPQTRLSGVTEVRRERNRATGALADGLVLGVTTAFAVRSQGRFSGELTWTHPTRFEGVDTGSRFRTRDRNQFDWRGSFEARVADWLNASLSYSGRALEGAPTTHLARAEARALF